MRVGSTFTDCVIAWSIFSHFPHHVDLCNMYDERYATTKSHLASMIIAIFINEINQLLRSDRGSEQSRRDYVRHCDVGDRSPPSAT